MDPNLSNGAKASLSETKLAAAPCSKRKASHQQPEPESNSSSSTSSSSDMQPSTWTQQQHADAEPNKRAHVMQPPLPPLPPTETAQEQQVPWPEDIHRQFCQAIYQVGVKHASPAVILENMTMEDAAVTSERVKSHLQKYRSSGNKSKSTQEFIQEYESWMQKALTMGAAGGASDMVPPVAIMDMMGTENILGGDAAAFLAYSVMAQEQQAAAGDPYRLSPDMMNVKDLPGTAGARLPFPTLTEEERKSPLGVSISHVMGLFYSMTQHVMKEREAATGQVSTPAEVVDANVSAAPPAGSEPAEDVHEKETSPGAFGV